MKLIKYFTKRIAMGSLAFGLFCLLFIALEYFNVTNHILLTMLTLFLSFILGVCIDNLIDNLKGANDGGKNNPPDPR